MSNHKASSSFFGHPLTITCVGFLLTGVLGLFVSKYYERAQINLERRIEAIEKRKEYISQISTLLYERYTKTSLLVSCIQRDASPDEISIHKQNYHSILIEWGTNLQPSLFAIREVLPVKEYSQIEQRIYGITGTYDLIQQCLNEVFHTLSRDRNKSKTIIDTCGIFKYLSDVQACSYTATNELFKLSAKGISDFDIEVIEHWQADSVLLSKCK